MFYRSDMDALAYRDGYLTRGDEEHEAEPCEECCTCGSEIMSGDRCYRIRNNFICRICFEVIAEDMIL